MIADGVPYGQAMRAIHRRALAEGKRHWLVPELGYFHKKLHLLEAIGKLSWSLGYDSLAIYLGKKKVMRESQKGVFEVHQDFLAMVLLRWDVGGGDPGVAHGLCETIPKSV
ncbi:hypothetical protein CYMTET_42961 [Cymbomonas tetramitiformis]|uniref:Uncharacterized protein n=1 Tax=Cymbomonas tetramitiformis TaxID=36881 RepID=A0AAE0C581_9CHLO|nr:hypothetical protein CYMTET_42961 [Cymbomonas tetramitiformis]